MLAKPNNCQIYDFSNMADEDIIKLIQDEGNAAATEYIIKKYKNLVKAKSRAYFLIGAEKEDLYQEGMIGLYKSIRDFDYDLQATYASFAEMCVTRQIITAIKSATRQKHSPLNNYVSLNKPVYDDQSERTLLDILVGQKVVDPEEVIIDKEEFFNIEMHLSMVLSRFEWIVLTLYLEGRKYQDIAQILDKSVKSIDNALQRIKKKVEKYLNEKETN